MEHQGDSGSIPTIYSVTANIIYGIESTLELPSGKAKIARLRNSMGRPIENSIENLGTVLEALPDEYLGTSRNLTKEELAIITAIQLYAMHQQGFSNSINLKWNDAKNLKYKNLGYSLSFLRNAEDTTAIDRRFNSLICSATFEELSHHLRQLIRLYKARLKEDSLISYPLLAQDLHSFLLGYEQSIRLNWSRAYYGSYRKKDSEEKEEI